ncbi:hypothetical protein Poli38472_007810 [Pythium oligandrum]|uniref:Calponin-homology (CH) domain-containing protein n=1 Tax=Pythium oligandrum TaxID=41045 RepID=A0A8K1CTS4_PYTOL|nr:hypothetical protein Poli38472_007810 [Pythium oligandrum]|eukprot:TMW68138.1 hypothetical protein Poli38472_007810 [Pythium oligandrum]
MSYQLHSSFLQKFTPKEIHELKRVFKEHDHDYAAAIATGDLHTVLLKMGENVTPNQVTTILKQVSLERSAQITFPEFLNLFYDLRTGGIALDAAALMDQVSISPVSATPTAPAPMATPSVAPTVEKVPFFPAKPSWPPTDAAETPVEASPFAQKAQWPPTGAAAASQPPAPSNGAAKQWPPSKSTPSMTTTTAPAGKAQWPPAGSAPAPAPAPEASSKPKWGTSSSVKAPSAKPQWQQTQAAAPTSPSKPQWPPTQANAPASPAKPQWPPSQTTAPASPPKPAAGKAQWPPASSPQRQQPAPSPQKTQWPPSAAAPAPPVASPVAPKPQWPPQGSSAPSPEPKRSQWPPKAPLNVAASTSSLPVHTSPPTPEPAAMDAHSIGVLQRRASAAAMYNANVTIHEVKGTASSVHSYSEEETAAFTEHITNCLHHDKDLSAVFPIRAKDGLFRAVSDGVVLCKLVNAAVPETIDTRAMNIKKNKQLNIYEMTENQNLCINAAKSIGCSVVNVGPMDLIEGRPILVLGLVWQIIKIQLTSTINLKNHPELVRLLLDGESLEEFMKLPPDQILLRWMNYHLKAAGHPKSVTNFSSDLQDATAYSVLLHQIAPQQCDLCHENVPEERAAHVIQNARGLGIETFIKPRDITSGNPKLNMSFVAQLFNTCPALDIVEEDLKQLEEILYDDIGDTREERVFRMWINSLGIDEVYINHLYSDLREGINLLKLFEKIEKGIVSWQKVNLVAPNTFKMVENCNYCVVLGKQLKFSLVNIGGADIFEANKKLILSIIWQSMRHHQLKLLSDLARARGHSTGEGITDSDIIQWANAKVLQAGRVQKQIHAFRDLSLADGVYLLALVHAVEPRAVNWDLVTPGHTDEDKASNAKYAISCAQKIGATVFLTYEDIVEVKPKMMMTFVASLMSVDMHRQ